jgi:hypothetical protein
VNDITRSGVGGRSCLDQSPIHHPLATPIASGNSTAAASRHLSGRECRVASGGRAPTSPAEPLGLEGRPDRLGNDIHAFGPRQLAPGVIGQQISRDAKQPGALAPARLVDVSATHDAQKHVLREVVREIGAASRETEVSPQWLPVLLEERGRETVVSAGHTMHKRARR